MVTTDRVRWRLTCFTCNWVKRSPYLFGSVESIHKLFENKTAFYVLCHCVSICELYVIYMILSAISIHRSNQLGST